MVLIIPGILKKKEIYDRDFERVAFRQNLQSSISLRLHLSLAKSSLRKENRKW